jgi:hypothetical protein
MTKKTLDGAINYVCRQVTRFQSHQLLRDAEVQRSAPVHEEAGFGIDDLENLDVAQAWDKRVVYEEAAAPGIVPTGDDQRLPKLDRIEHRQVAALGAHANAPLARE